MKLIDLLGIVRCDLKIFYCDDSFFIYYPDDSILSGYDLNYGLSDDFLNMEVDHVSIICGFVPYLRVYLK